jgi:hypothetical protein
MERVVLLKPTLHIEVQLKSDTEPDVAAQITRVILECLASNYVSTSVGDIITGYGSSQCCETM